MVEAFCQAATLLETEDLAVVADELLNLESVPEEEAKGILIAAAGAYRRQGARSLQRAIRVSRRGARSPAETRIRLTLDAAGVSPAELNAAIEETGTKRYLGSPDFVWRAQRVVLEYEGRRHLIDERQFRYDIVRYDDLMADGWRVIRATGDDLSREGRARLAQRVLRALADTTPV